MHTCVCSSFRSKVGYALERILGWCTCRHAALLSHVLCLEVLEFELRPGEQPVSACFYSTKPRLDSSTHQALGLLCRTPFQVECALAQGEKKGRREWAVRSLERHPIVWRCPASCGKDMQGWHCSSTTLVLALAAYIS